MRRIAMVVVLAVACGGGGDSESIEGSWALYSDGCMFGVDFRDGRAAWALQCELEDGTIGFDGQRGTYELDGDELVTRTIESTCPPEPDDYKPERVKYVVDGETLTLFFDDGIVTFERADDESASAGTWTYGCFDGGKFTPGPLRKI